MNRNLRLASKLLSSSVLGQLAVLGAISVAASGMDPADFASYGVVTAASFLLASGNTLAAELRSAVVDEPGAAALTRAGASVALAIAGVVALVGVALVGHHSTTGWSLVLVAGCGLLLGLQQLLTGLVLREQRQELLARNRLVQAFTNALLILASLATPMPAWVGLSLAWLASLVAGNVVIVIALRRRLRHLGRPRVADLRLLLSEVKLQPVANLMASSAAQLPVLTLQAFGAATVVGAWALVSRFLTPVVNSMVSTLQPIYYGRAAQLLRDGKVIALSGHHLRWMRRLLLAGIVVAVSVVIGVLWVLPLLGEEWDVARSVVVPAVLSFTVLFVCQPLSQTLVLLGRPNLQFGWTATRLTLCAVPLLLQPWIGAQAALTTWAVMSALTFLSQLALHRRAIGELRRPA